MLFRVKKGHYFGASVPQLTGGAIVELPEDSARGFTDCLEPYYPEEGETPTVESSALTEPDDLTALNGVGVSLARKLAAAGYPAFKLIASADAYELAQIKGVSMELAEGMIAEAKKKVG